jgi:protein polybromo-1
VFNRPHETYHVTTRRFLEQEIFKTESFQVVPLDQVMGKCYVMNVKDYFKYKPEGS